MRVSSALTAALTALLVTPTALAQGVEIDSRFMMLNQHVCPPENMGAVMDFVESTMAPALAATEEAGEIDDWGVLTHNWGDEWNFNFYIVAEDHRAFLDAWEALVGRLNEARPGWYDEFAPLCTMHKDNLYTLNDYGG